MIMKWLHLVIDHILFVSCNEWPALFRNDLRAVNSMIWWYGVYLFNFSVHFLHSTSLR